MTSVYLERVKSILSDLPGTTLLERGQGFRFLGLGVGLLLVLELFGQPLGQSQIGCMRTINERNQKRGDATYMNRHPLPERRRKTSEWLEP